MRPVQNMKYDYKESIKSDVLEYIKGNIILEDMEISADNAESVKEEIRDGILEYGGEITGELEGGHASDPYEAKERIADNRKLLNEAVRALCPEGNEDPITKDPMACDVIIRKYLLPQIVSKTVDEIINEHIGYLRKDIGINA